VKIEVAIWVFKSLSSEAELNESERYAIMLGNIYMKQKYIVGLGAAVMDYLQLVDAFPKANTKIRSKGASLQGGGSAMTALVTLAKLGMNTQACSVVGDDALGKMIISDLESHNVGSSHIQKLPKGASSLSSVLITEKTRTIVGHYALESSFNLNKVKSGFWKNVTVLHLDGHHAHAAFAAAKLVKKAGGLISVDGGHASPDIEALLPLADIMIMSETFITEQLKKDTVANQIKKLYHRYQPKVLIITRGDKGVWYWENDKVKKVSAFRVKAKDTTGAGDVFHGAFLYAYLKNYSLVDAITFAQAASALKVQHVGARTGIPSYKSIKDFLKTK
jgi:sulfofructose kinase